MSFEPTRLRFGELVAGVAAVLLLIDMFLLPWWGLSGRLAHLLASFGVSDITANAWDSLSFGRWLMLATIAVTLLLVIFQAIKAGPAWPVTLSMLSMVLGIVTALELIYRVLINGPYSIDGIATKPGAYLGLACSLVLAYGGFRSTREEGGSKVPLEEIPTVRVQAGRGQT
jgi:hypothetical protein